MTDIEKIRAALEQADALIPDFSYLRTKQDEALAALAELERAAKEPVAWCNPADFALFVGKPRTGAQTFALDVFSQRGGLDTMPLYTTPPPAPVAEIRKHWKLSEVTQEMCERVAASFYGADTFANGVEMHESLQLWQRELGQTLGLVSREEVARMVESAYREGIADSQCKEWRGGEYITGNWQNSNARRAVMWPKGGES